MHEKWKLNPTDIKTAFLQGEEIDRKVFGMPPKEAETNNVWLLKKCVYGLGDASRKWCNTVKSFLLSTGLKMWSGTNDFETSYTSKLLKNVVIGKENHSAF